MAFVPNSGAVSTDIISDVFGLGDDFNNYRNTVWYYPGNLMYGYFSGGTIKSSDFYGKQPNDPATAGILFSNTAGSGSFVVPLYRNTITIEIWGAGGGGGGANGSDGIKGGDTSISNYQPISGPTVIADYTAGGGKGGQNGVVPTPAPPINVQTSGGGGKQLGQYGYSYGGKDYTAFTDSTGQLVGTVVQDSKTGAVISTIGDTGPYGTDATRDNPF